MASPSIVGVTDYLRDTGTGQLKLDIVKEYAESMADATPLAFITALIAHGSPINKGTIAKAQVYFGMIDAPDEVKLNTADIDAIADDPFDSEKVDEDPTVKKSGSGSKKSGKKSGKKKTKKKGKKKKAKKKASKKKKDQEES